MLSPLDSTGLPVVALIAKNPQNTDPRGIVLVVNVDMHNTAFEVQGESRVALIDTAYVQSVPGKGPQGVNGAMPVKMTLEGFDKLMKNGLTMRRPLTLLPEATQIRVVVRDTRSGSIGSVTIPIGKTNLKLEQPLP